MRRGLVLHIILALTCMVGVALGMQHDPHAVDLSNKLASPSTVHLLGTDHLGRDLASRLAWGALPSLAAIALVLTGGLGLGLLAGGIMALGPRALRIPVQWLAETALAVPTLVTALVLSTLFGAGITTVAAALVATSWAPYALSIAALCDRVRGEPYWLASQSLGTSLPTAMLKHMLPNIWPAIGALAGTDAGRAIILVSSFGFMGLSADTGRPEWGAMINEYRMFLFSEPRLILAPILACTFVGILLHAFLDHRNTNKFPQHDASNARLSMKCRLFAHRRLAGETHFDRRHHRPPATGASD